MMRERIVHAVPLVVTLLICLSLALALSQSANKPKERMVGKTIAAFDIPVLGDAKARFSPALWNGKPAIINIFASWCEPCQLEHEQLMRLGKASGIPLYGIAWKDHADKTQRMLENGNPYTLVGADENGDVTMAFAMTGVPETFIVDSKGIVRYHVNAPITDAMLDKDILPLLASQELQP